MGFAQNTSPTFTRTSNVERKIVNVTSSVIEDEVITFLDEMDNIGYAYSDADIVIISKQIGTRLKIKTKEALSYGKPLVSFLLGLARLSRNTNFEYCLTSKNDDFFASITILLLNFIVLKLV